MKKFYTLLSCFLFTVCALQTQPLNSPNSISTSEEIFLFDVDIQVQPNGEIQVKEYISLLALGQQIRRGIYRDIPTSLTEQVMPISLTMDGTSHPFFTQRQLNSLRINFGNDNSISKGIHAYTFRYTYTGAINFLKDYDELYWNVTGNDWAFPIEKARVRVTFPDNVAIQKDGISVYTGRAGEKQHHAEQIAPLTFQTTRPLRPKEGLTIAIPFNKGAIQKPPLALRLDFLFSFPFVIFLALFVFLIGYFIFTWFAVGRDPAYLAIVQYDPPQAISPAFMYYLQNQNIDAKLLATIILDLAMKGYVEIKTKPEPSANIPSQVAQNKIVGLVLGLIASPQLIRTDKQPDNLSYEERQVLEILFATSPTLVLNSSAAQKFQTLNKAIKTYFEKDAKQYIISNGSLVFITLVITIILGTVPFILFKRPELIFVNLHFSIFFLVSTLSVHKISAKIGMGLFFTLFYSAFWFAGGTLNSLEMMLCQLMFIISMWGLSFYNTLIRNVTPMGKDIFEHIAGFKKYMKTAETYRVSASDPIETEKIFCNYLPFAFALGMENQWIEKFSHIISKATIEKYTSSVGGMHFVSKGLSRSISSAMPSKGGSHGGGCSGGGHGGGGGGGR